MLLLTWLACAPAPTHATLPLAAELAAEGRHDWAPDATPFDWIPAVWGFGLHRLHQAGDPDAATWYRAWIEAALPDFEPERINSSDSLSPAVLASAAMIEDPSLDYRLLTDAADAYLEVAPRTSQGAIAHWGTDRPWGTTQQVWLDSQFMFGVYLLREYERTADPAPLDLWRSQHLLVRDLCRDEARHLYRHAWDDEIGANIPEDAVFWARGNAWVLVSAAERLALGDDPEVRELFRAQATAVAALQDPDDGLWHTVLDFDGDPANYTETSASALIAYALVRGVRAGALPEPEWRDVIDRAVQGVQGRVRRQTDGTLEVRGTSYGTNPGDYAYYVGIGVGDDLMLGVGAVVALLAEADGLRRADAESR